MGKETEKGKNMKLNIIQNTENIVVIPSIYKDMENPPTFIFRSPNSQDMLNFLWGGNNVFEAVCNCFVEFKNKIELEVNGKPYEYSNYREFVNAGIHGDIALIHNDCMNAVALRLTEMAEKARKTEKKSQSLTNSTQKAQEDNKITPQDTETKEQ